MKAVLVRVGVDQKYGRWNAPVDPQSHRFVSVPIPERLGMPFHPHLERRFNEVVGPLRAFCGELGLDLSRDLRFPEELLHQSMHLDPDFETLTYGDDGARRGAGVRGMKAGDVIVFFASLRPIRECGHKLLYALVGLYTVEEVLHVRDVPCERWHENAHTRKSKRGENDIVVRAKRGASGRLEKCIPIGEYRDESYRVRRDLLDVWGGLSVKDGYIQRSAVPPRFLDPARFLKWFEQQNPVLIARNN